MKVMTILLAGILLVSPQIFADLSVTDLDKIREIVKESETRMKDIITSSETRMKEYVSQEIAKVDIKLIEMDKRLTNSINAVDTQVGRNYNLILAFIALIVFAVGVPQIITAWQGRKLREQTEKYEELKQEIETLKQELIVRP